jgi:glutamate/tyrosine decarboxylase-like PLP-dependent enzyme
MHSISDETERVVDRVLDASRRRILLKDVPLDKPMTPADLARLASGSISPGGLGDARALALFEHVLAPACISVDHPEYLSFIPSAPSKAALAFDLVVSASAVYGGSWLEGAGAVFAENEVLHWLAAEFGLPAGAGGVFVQGGTIGNLSALVAARARARRVRRSVGAAMPASWVLICSDEAHSSVASAAEVMDVEIVLAPADAEGRLRGEAVREALLEHGDSVFAVVATAGSTNFGTVDHLESIAALKDEHDFWLHVDGAYGLAGILTDETRGLFRGVERADSVIVDPHKWLFAPFDACALIYRDPLDGRIAHTQSAGYLDTLNQADEWNPSDFAIQLTRRPRGLPLWFSLATHGTDAYREAIGACVRLAREIADEIRTRPQLRLVREPDLSVVVFEREGWAMADYERWSAGLLDQQQAFVTPSSHHGRPVTRFAIVNPRSSVQKMSAVLDTMR